MNENKGHQQVTFVLSIVIEFRTDPNAAFESLL